ncbi:MAG: hypothetical protein WC372_00500 [Candidatus Neomarinimicrobiota bacterium]|jgi:hypothetical protein
MDTKKLLEILDMIKDGTFPKKHKYFSGAHLIITNEEPGKEAREDSPGLVFVVSPHASELSWLVFQLKEVHHDELDYLNKYGFYPGLGRCMNGAMAKKNTLKETMYFTAFQGLLFWIYPPLLRDRKEMILDLLEDRAGPVPKPENDGLTIGQILKAIEEGRPIAENRNKAMHEWMRKATGKETGIKDK